MAFDASHCSIMVDQRVSLRNARPSSNNVFSFPPLFSLSNLEKYVTLEKKKQKKGCVICLIHHIWSSFFLLYQVSFIFVFNLIPYHLIFLSNLSSYFMMF